MISDFAGATILCGGPVKKAVFNVRFQVVQCLDQITSPTYSVALADGQRSRSRVGWVVAIRYLEGYWMTGDVMVKDGERS